MQFAIRDDAARTIAAVFYKELALSQPVDAAIAEARKSVMSCTVNFGMGNTGGLPSVG